MADLYRLRAHPVPPASRANLWVNPPSAVQETFFERALSEPPIQRPPGMPVTKLVKGPHTAPFDEWQAKYPPGTRLSNRRLRQIGYETLTPELLPQTVPVGLITRPNVFRRQGEGSPYEPGMLSVDAACMNTCFRMIFDDLTGWICDEQVLYMVMKRLNARLYGGTTAVTPDHHYLQIFHTGEFAKICARRVESCYISGSDFAQIATIAERAKTRKPGTDVYCIATVESEDDEIDGLAHDLLLIEATPDTVTTWDPRPYTGGKDRLFEKGEFIRRWAVGRNAAMLMLAHPLTETGNC